MNISTPYVLINRLRRKLKKIKINLRSRYRTGYCIEEEIYLTDSKTLSKQKISIKERKYLYQLFREKGKKHEERKDK